MADPLQIEIQFPKDIHGSELDCLATLVTKITEWERGLSYQQIVSAKKLTMTLSPRTKRVILTNNLLTMEKLGCAVTIPRGMPTVLDEAISLLDFAGENEIVNSLIEMKSLLTLKYEK